MMPSFRPLLYPRSPASTYRYESRPGSPDAGNLSSDGSRKPEPIGSING